MQKGFARVIFLILSVLIIIFIFSYIFIARPYKVSGDQVITPFKNDEIVFSEKISYLFNKPIIDDRVIFRPQGKEMDFVGIVTKVENQDNITTYTIISTGKGQPWVVSADKITGKIYYPFINKEEIKSSSTLAQCKICKDSWDTICSGNSSCVVPEGSSEGVCLPILKMGQDYTISQINNLCSTNFSDNILADWKTYTNNPWKYTFQYPSNFQVRGENMGNAEENLDVLVASLESFKTSMEYLDYPFFRVQVTSNVITDLESYVDSSYSSNKINNQLNSKLEKFVSQNLTGWKYDFSGKVFNTTSSEGKTDGNSGFVINHAGELKIVFLENKNNIYVILLADSDPFNNILSTFKFTN